MRRSSFLPLFLMASVGSFSACKNKQAAPAKEQSAAAPKAEATPKKAPAAESKKIDAEKAQSDDAKNCLGALEPAAAFVPGTLVSLPAPQGYAHARHFPGYQQGTGQDKPSIVVSEFPMPLSTAKKALSNEKIWARQEMQLVAVDEKVSKSAAGSCKGTLIEVVKNGDKAVHKFVWLFGNKEKSFQVMASCPEPCAETEAAKLRQAIQGARWNPERKSRRWDGLRFSLNPNPLRAMEGAMMSGYRRTFTTTGQPDKKGEQMVFQVSSSVEPAKEQTEAFAKERLERLPMNGLEITSSSKTKSRLTGLEGWTFEAKGATRSGADQWLTFTLLFDKDTYWTTLGMCPIAEKSKCKPIFKRIANSVHFIDAI